MKKAVTLRFLLIIMITALLSGLASAFAAAVREEARTREALVQLCQTIAAGYAGDIDAAALAAVLGGERVTVIAADGTVLDDSQASPETMENHAVRSEVKNARTGYVATDVRRSQTLGQPFMFAAIKLSDGTILRLARSYGGLDDGLIQQLPVFLITFFVVALIAALIARTLTSRILRPLEEFTATLSSGNYDDLPEDSGYYEINKITGRIRQLLQKLTQSQQEIQRQHDKINFILSNMEEGFILLDGQGTITLINSGAKRIFQVDGDFSRQNILTLTRSSKLASAVNTAIADGVSTVFDMKIDEVVYSAHVSPVSGAYVDSEGSGATILLIDVSDQRQSQRQRSEFFSNASHELKTPMTTVTGLTEMLKNGMLDDRQREPIYTRIFDEVSRMNALINDILSISRLESGTIALTPEPVVLSDVIRDVLLSLQPQAEAAGVTIDVSGGDCVIEADRRQMRELVGNLMENAVKYNRPGGRVSVSAVQEGAHVRLTVADTGIGIPADAHPRIFERFFRVDSGRSKGVGGTGLGLSIVKHITLSMGGDIALQSEPDSGTAITVTLPVKPAEQGGNL